MEYSFWKDGHQLAWLVVLVVVVVGFIWYWKKVLGPYYDPESPLSKDPDGKLLPRTHWSVWMSLVILVVGLLFLWGIIRAMGRHDKWERSRLQQTRPAIIQQAGPQR